MLFKVLDINRIPVILSKDTWFIKLLDPIFGHPEVKPFLPQIKKTIKNPDYVYPSYSGLQLDRAKKQIRWVYTEKLGCKPEFVWYISKFPRSKK